MSFISKINSNGVDYDIRDERITGNITAQDVNKLLAVDSDGNIVPKTVPDGLVLDINNHVIKQGGVDQTANVGIALQLDKKADLDENGKVPEEQLPEMANDVLEFPSEAEFPQPGATGKLYISRATNDMYRYTVENGYIKCPNFINLGETSDTAYRGDRGKIAFDHSQNMNNPHGTTPQQIGAVAKVNDSLPDEFGTVTLNEVPYAQNLTSVDNQEDVGQFDFRTAGGDASINTGDATLGYIQGNSVVVDLNEETHQATSITIAQPLTFKSILLNQFNKSDVTMVLENQTIQNGQFVPNQGTYAAIIHVVGGVVAGNGNKGYTAAWLKANNTLPDGVVDPASLFVTAGWLETKPTVSSTGIISQSPNWVTGGLDSAGESMPKRANFELTYVDELLVTHDLDNGYLIIITTDINHLNVHPRWSGYMDGAVGTYTESVITVPTKDSNGNDLPSAVYGMPSLLLPNGDIIRDEINFNSRQYIQRIGYKVYSAENLAEVQAMGVYYIYSSTCILYQLTSSIIHPLVNSVSGAYQVHDFGTEEFTYGANASRVACTADCWYGQNLKDKLRVDVVTISNQDLSNSQQTQVRHNIGAFGISEVGVPGGVAQLDENGKVPENVLPAFAKSVNQNFPDAAGNVTVSSVAFAQNLLSPDNDSDVDTYIYRTSGGEASLSDGEAQLTRLEGCSVNPTKIEESFIITPTDVTEGTPIAVSSIDKVVWRNNATVGWTSGTYTFEFDGTQWKVSSVEAGLVERPITLAECGITLTGTPAEHDKIIVQHTRTNNANGYASNARALGPNITSQVTIGEALQTAGFKDIGRNAINFTYNGSTWDAVQGFIEYSAEGTYDVGNYVTHSGNIYKCTTAVTTPEPFDSAKWSEEVHGATTITASAQSLTTYTITLSAGALLVTGDILQITYNSASSMYSVVAQPKAGITFDQDTQFDPAKWYGTSASTGSALKNDSASFEFLYTTDTGWVLHADIHDGQGVVDHLYTRTQLSTIYGITFTIISGSTPSDYDRITINSNIVNSMVTNTVDYVGPNVFDANWGEDEAAGKATWKSIITSSGSYRFTLNLAETAWDLTKDGTAVASSVQLATYGLTLEGTPGRKDYITVDYDKLYEGEIINASPTIFKSVGTQQFNFRNFVSGYKIENNEIVAGTDTDYLAWIHACYSNLQGWTLYTTEGFGNIEIGWSDTEPTSAQPVVELDPNVGALDCGDSTKFHLRTDLGGKTYDSSGEYVATSPAELFNFFIPEDHEPGYIIISMTKVPAVSNTEGNLTVHPRWSGYKNLVTGYESETTYDEHSTLISIPQYALDAGIGEIVELPIHEYGMPSVEAVADLMQLTSAKYDKKIERVTNTPQHMAETIASGVAYSYDADYIYRVMTNPVTYWLVNYVAPGVKYYETSACSGAGTTLTAGAQVNSLAATYGEISVAGVTKYVKRVDVNVIEDTYVVADFGTEEFLNTDGPVTAESLYGQNLRDKLRTDVVTISTQELSTAQKAQVRTNIDAQSASGFDTFKENEFDVLASGVIRKDIVQTNTTAQQDQFKENMDFNVGYRFTVEGNGLEDLEPLSTEVSQTTLGNSSNWQGDMSLINGDGTNLMAVCTNSVTSATGGGVWGNRSGYAAYSRDGGKTWTFNNTTSCWWKEMDYHNGVWEIVGCDNSYTKDATSYGTGRIYYSVNGTGWGTPTLEGNWNSVTHSNGNLWVAVGSHTATNRCCVYSTNGTSWSWATVPSYGPWSKVIYDGRKFVAFKWGTADAMTSTDGITWTAKTLSVAGRWNDAVYTNGYYWIVTRDALYKADSNAFDGSEVTLTRVTCPVTKRLTSVVNIPDWSGRGTIDLETFLTMCRDKTTDETPYTFTYTETGVTSYWTFNGNQVDLADYGIDLGGSTPLDGNTIKVYIYDEVVFGKLVGRGDYVLLETKEAVEAFKESTGYLIFKNEPSEDDPDYIEVEEEFTSLCPCEDGRILTWTRNDFNVSGLYYGTLKDITFDCTTGFELNPNESLIFEDGYTGAQVTLAAPFTRYESEYRITFTARGQNYNLTLVPPTGYIFKWVNDYKPAFENGLTYEISILNSHRIGRTDGGEAKKVLLVSAAPYKLFS